MPPLRQLFTRSLRLLRLYPALVIPPIASALFFALWGTTVASNQVFAFLVAGLINLAVTAGWIGMIARAERGDRPAAEDFFNALGQSFGSLFVGHLNFLLLLMLLALPLVSIAMSWIGPVDPKWIESELAAIAQQAAKPQTLANLDPRLLEIATKAATLASIWLAAFVLLSLLLVVWVQAVVLDRLPWVGAWRQSGRFFRAQVKPLLGLLTLQALGQLTATALLLTPFTAVAGHLWGLAISILFTVVFTLAYLAAAPPLKMPAESSPSPHDPPA